MSISHQLDFSIVVPTYQEAQNIAELIKRISLIDFNQRSFELILVDDNSQDGIIDVVDQLRDAYPWLKLVVRSGKRSLSESVIEGFNLAKHPLLITMDADLSHPPEKIPELLAALSDHDTDFVIGSRYVAGGNTDEKWPLMRRMTSQCSSLTARLLLNANVRDPLSGFFGIKKSTFKASDTLNPVGWKIGLEIMIKCHCKQIKEIPIHFSQRRFGHSKLNIHIILGYLRHITRLGWYKMTYSRNINKQT